jgi:hypothetical protein
MPMIEFSERDLLRGRIVEPAWYVLNVESVGEAPSKDGGSVNYPVEATIVQNDDNGDTKFAGTPITWNFNSKAMGFSVGFLKAMGVDVQPGKRYDLGGAAGKQIVVFVENAEYEGRTINRVNHKYRSLKAETV